MAQRRKKVGRPRVSRATINERLAFGRTVKKRLIDKGLNQSELAGLVGISISNMNNIIRGAKPGVKHRHKIAEILDIDLCRGA